MQFLFIDRHTRRNVVNQLAGRNPNHQHRFFFPHVHDLSGDDFGGLRSDANGSRLVLFQILTQLLAPKLAAIYGIVYLSFAIHRLSEGVSLTSSGRHQWRQTSALSEAASAENLNSAHNASL